jgi:hypothetical protein
MECVFAVTATHPCYRSGPIIGERIKIWILKHRNLSHSHALESNPFHYQEHSLLHPGNLLAIADGTKHRELKTSYRRYLRAQNPNARHLTELDYYNLGYDRHSIQENQP